MPVTHETRLNLTREWAELDAQYWTEKTLGNLEACDALRARIVQIEEALGW